MGKFMYRNSNQTLPSTFDEYFRHIDHHYDTRTRSNHVCSLPTPRTDFGKQSIKFAGIKIWSDIPNTIKSAQTRDNFTLKLKTYLVQNTT